MNIQLTNATLVAVCSALTLSSWFVCGFLIRRHFQEFSQRTIQLLILYIIVFPPLYSLESVLSIAFPSVAIYLAILLDCYMSYCLYAFFLLMMNMLGCEEDDFKLVAYLETKTSFNLGFPLNVLCSKDLARGKAFLLYCRSGILQLCVLKPLVTLTSLVLNQLHLYNEFSTSFTDGYLYLLILLNVSVIYAFAALAAFYTVFKMKLKPFHASKKFTWIICVVFFTFWQDVIVTGIVQAGVISDLGSGSTPLVSTRIQDLLICIEMLLASIACWWIFSYEPYTSGYVNPYDYSDYDEEVDVYERSGRPGAVGANYRYSMLNTDGEELEEGRTKKGRSSNRSNSSRKPVTSSISGGKATLEFTDPSRMPAAMDRGMTSSGGENDGGAGGESSGGKGKIAKKLKSLRGPSDMLRRFSGGSSGASRLTATTAVVANKPPEAKVELLPNTGGPSEYTTAKTNRTKKPEVAVAMSKASFVIEGEEEDEEDAGKNQPPPFQNSATDELPEDVMLLLGAKKGRVGAAATTAEVARDLNDFGQDGEVAPGSTVLRSIQSRYADTEYEVDVNRSSLSSITNNDISGLVNGAIEVGNPLLESQQQNAAEAEEAAVSSWAGKSMKERAASMEQRLVDQSGASSSSSSPRVNVIKKTVTVTKKTKKHHHHNSSQQSQSSAASQSVDKG